LSSFRRLFIGGEATDVRKLRQWLASPNCNCQIIHIYGPSECSDVSTIHVPRPNELFQVETMPLGKPINNVSAYVVDEHLNLQPVGVPGELCISGIGLAWGFFDRPGMTAEKFVPNPYRAGQRMYRTGDRVRSLPTGEIEFLGRTDYQVKIRGIRIELGEIEMVLSRHSSVRDAIVIAHKGPAEDKRLVAYLVAKEGQEPDPASLRIFLSELLPSFMVPAVFVILDHLPLTPNGKVDRSALPAPETARLLSGTPTPGPRNAVEEILAGFWVELLGKDSIGIHDNFFDLGGHSLLATQLVSRVRDAFQLDFPLRRVFEAPTIAELAQSLLRDDAFGQHVERIAPLLLNVGRLSEHEVEEWLERNSG
jgi:surfactin family lipopeptide synthetase C